MAAFSFAFFRISLHFYLLASEVPLGHPIGFNIILVSTIEDILLVNIIEESLLVKESIILLDLIAILRFNCKNINLCI